MNIRSTAKPQRANLLALGDAEKVKMLRQIARRLRQLSYEKRLLHSWLALDRLTINGITVFDETQANSKRDSPSIKKKGVYKEKRLKR
ncbi:MAG: hypothetical protein QXJ02_03275 [Candidatus Bathyarchaeia archaeon]